MELKDLMGKLDTAIAGQEEIKKSFATLDGRVATIEKQPVYPPGVSGPADVLKAGGVGELGTAPNVPNVLRKSELGMSRPFSFQRLFAAMGGLIPHEKADVEFNLQDRLRKSLVQSGYYSVQSGGYTGYNCHSGTRHNPHTGRALAESFPAIQGNTFLAPLSSDHLPEDVCGSEFIAEVKSLCAEDFRKRDPEAQASMLSKTYNIPIQKVMSWLDSTTGGGFVKPAEFGEILELLRNQEALSRAGARTMAMPAQGRIVFPRIASPTTGSATVENAAITASDLGTGTLVLSPKKIGALVKMPNELLRYTSQAAESYVRDDLTKTLALTMDFYGLEGIGGNDRPLGLIYYDNINTITSSNAGTNGDTISPQDPYLHIAACEENNAEFSGFIMRPQTLMRFFMYRFATITANDSQGGFAFDITRTQGASPESILAGYTATKSAQVSRSRTKAGGTGLTYILGGDWKRFIIAMFGAIEFAVSTQGDTPFAGDQTWIRAIITGDTGPTHERAFSFQDSLIF